MRTRKIFRYILTVDNGGAPHVTSSLLSLAICKPAIREQAEVGDIILGFAGKTLAGNSGRVLPGSLIYAARVTRKLVRGEYYRGAAYQDRHDCIYEFVGERLQRRPKARYHSVADMARDVGPWPHERAAVLLSTSFRYFGRRADESLLGEFPRLKSEARKPYRGYRSSMVPPELARELERATSSILESNGKKMVGNPCQGKHDDRARHIRCE